MPVLDSAKVEDLFVIVHDYMSYPKDKPAKNLCAYNGSGTKVWETVNHTNEKTDAFTKIISKDPLKVANFYGYDAIIDVQSGKIIAIEEKR